MSLSLFPRKAFLSCSLAATIPGVLLGQGAYAPYGTEYAVDGTLPGEQVRPALALSTSGGFLVWEDNISDGYGLGISAVRLDSTLSAPFASFRVNATGADDQELPQVSLLKDGGAAFVWQGGPMGFQHIYARLLSSASTWITDDILVNADTGKGQVNPAVATLNNSNVVVVYGSMNQQSTNSLQDVYGQVLSPTGQKLGGEFLVNQFTSFNQRDASVAALAGGGFIVVWVSEQQRSGSVDNISADYLYGATNRASVDIFGRLYTASGTPAGSEFRVNSTWDICAHPHVAADSDGGFMVTWGQKSLQAPVLGWDIYARPFSPTGVGGSAVTVNSTLYGDQYSPTISALGSDYFIAWTSLGQDGSREGCFGRFVRSTAALVGQEFRINGTTIAQQMHPALAADGNGRFLAVWTSFRGGAGSFELYAQRYLNEAQPLVAMASPFVYVPFVLNSSNVYQPQLQVSWPFAEGMAVDHYEVYVDGSVVPTVTLKTNIWLMTSANGLTPSSTHSFKVAYVATDGRRSPLSTATTATTWSGYNWGGIPFEWMASYYGGYDTLNWPRPDAKVAPGGPAILQVFLSGANPLDPATWLRTDIVGRAQGWFLTWNPQPGLIYQVQTSQDLSTWQTFGSPRFAAGASDEIYLGLTNTGYYRVLRLR